MVPAWVQVQARRAPLPLGAARERVVPVRAERARPPRDQVKRRRLAPIEVAPVQLVRPPPAVGRLRAGWSAGASKTIDTACKTGSSGAADQTTADKATPNSTCATPDAASAVHTEGPPFGATPHARSARSNPTSPRFSALHYICSIARKRRGGKRSAPTSIPEQTARGVSGRTHFRLSARFGSVWHQHGFSLWDAAARRASSGFRGLQPPRVRCPMSGDGEALPPDRVAGGGPGNTVGSSAADHPGGPQASARML